ncbi:uncharacterized protein LOC107609883 [Arachis ipaensis]|uniref:uncharacterized protein LOC107609883 n=1 Tax=Arachis ipaensis TaxID=130454 RepID=UPI0007AF15A7|nr:uncharacterized protein LOC107609883 [Arachis ipaensis]XP_025628474.1 uncharacterized protein LOC112721643 [Arachis hypogaea]
MVTEGIILGHRISSKGIEVDKAKVKLVYDKACHLPVELEHKAYWVTKFLNFDVKVAGEKRLFQLNELDEFRNSAYKNAKFYKEKAKLWHNKKITIRAFEPGQKEENSDRKFTVNSQKLKHYLGGKIDHQRSIHLLI